MYMEVIYNLVLDYNYSEETNNQCRVLSFPITSPLAEAARLNLVIVRV